MKKVLIVTGGSGGHVIPALSIYEHLKTNFDVSLVTDKRGERFIKKNENKYDLIDIPNLYSKLIFIPINILLFTYSIIKSMLFLWKKKINILVSTGGYSTIPLCVSAKFLGVKLYLLEPNMVLGRSNRYMLKYAKKILCYDNNLKRFPNKFKNKIRIIEPILMKKIYHVKKNQDKNFKQKIKIIILGGSQGAKFFDHFCKEIILKLSKKINVEVMQQISDKSEIKKLQNFYNKNSIKNIIFNLDMDIINKIGNYDIAITRCGASTISELVYLNVPFIGIPYPHAKDNHQLENADFYFKKNCCWIFEQKNINVDKILNLFKKLIDDSKIYNEKYQNIVKITYKNDWDYINKKLNGILNEN